MFPKPLKVARKMITIKQKLEVLKYYHELKAEKESMIQELSEPRPAGATRAELKAFFNKKKELRRKVRRNVQKLCAEKFPTIVKRSLVFKWARAAEAEKWSQLPDRVAARMIETPNTWRKQVGAPLKGQKLGGSVPWTIQKELDLLMVEASSGLSDVSERKELVTVEHVVSGLNTWKKQ